MIEQELYKPLVDDITTVAVPDGGIERRVIAAACKYEKFMVVGARHFSPAMHSQLCAMVESISNGPHTQGFIDQWDNFMTREDAVVVGKASGQLPRDYSGEIVFSEDFW
jgi:hypothetical protein